ncbi:hypothetical protein [Methylopila henanensis]|uniref:hypothetical protein n=1 Tax=Methylopila henanensis TaxID=873516 RepID=UPI00366F737C
MFALLSRAIARRAPRPAAPSPTDRALARFPGARGASVRRLARRSPRLADLALSYPGLLALLAAPGRRFDAESAIALVERGASLRFVAASVGAPMWARRLPPEAFAAADVSGLPDSPAFRRRIANALPASPWRADRWLRLIAEAARCGDDTFTVWVARKSQALTAKHDAAPVRLLALHAFFSSRADTEAGGLVESRWTPRAQAKAALEQAIAWRSSIDLHLHLADGVLAPRLDGGRILDLELTPLVTAQDISEEAAAMRNCLRGYGPDVRRGSEELWSLRRGGVRVATLSVGRPYRRPTVSLVEIKGPGNTEVAPEIWIAAERWLASQADHALVPPPVNWNCPVIAPARWRALWRPYWLALGRIPHWLPLQPPIHGLDDLRR